MKIIKTIIKITENEEYRLGRNLDDEVLRNLSQLFGREIYENKLLEAVEFLPDKRDPEYGMVRQFYMLGYLVSQEELKEISELIRIMKFVDDPVIRERVIKFEDKYKGVL